MKNNFTTYSIPNLLLRRFGIGRKDDYFHCKANYEATSRGSIGEKVAERLGNAKENFDYYYNQAWKGLSKQEAHKDRIHDRTVNKTDRQREKSCLYKNSKEGCNSFRVRGINDKY